MSRTSDVPSRPPGASASAPCFRLQQATEYDVDIHVLSGSGEFIIKRLTDSTPVFKLKRNNGSLHHVRRLCDMNDVPLYKFQKLNWLDFGFNSRIVDEISGRTALVLRRKVCLTGKGGNTIVAWNGESERGEPLLTAETGCLRRQFTIRSRDTGKVIAEARRERMGRRFVLNVQADNDAALLVIFAIAVDVIYQRLNGN